MVWHGMGTPLRASALGLWVLASCGDHRVLTGDIEQAPDDESLTTAREEQLCCDAGREATVCEGERITREPGMPNIMLVLDGSCSMSFEQALGWSELMDAVDPMLVDYGPVARMGLSIFPPNYGVAVNECTGEGKPEVSIADDNTEFMRSVLEAREPFGETPTYPTVVRSLTHLREQVDGERIMVLVTDGVAQTAYCYETSIEAEIETALRSDQIATYVIGLGSELDWVAMDRWAAAGGTGRAVAPTDTQGLERALSEMAGNAVGCKIGLRPPDDFGDELGSARLRLDIGGEVHLGSLPDGAPCESGFRLRAHDPAAATATVELCGRACELLSAGAPAQFSYACGG